MKDTSRSSELDLSPLHLLHRAGQFADVLFSRNISEADLTPRQYAVLACVAQQEDLSQADIVARTGIDRSTLADVVRRLSSQGLLVRKRTREDARRYAVRLTEKGQELLGKAQPAARAADGHLLATLHKDQREAFIEALRQMITALDHQEHSKA